MAVNVGLVMQRDANEPAPASNAQMSVIGMALPVVKADGVNQTEFEDTFVANELKLFNSTDAVARMIEPDSELGRALTLINAQAARYQRAAKVILNPVAAGVNEDATIANIVGNSTSLTGIHRFKRAGADVGFYPRLIVAPGFTKQTKKGVVSAAIGAAGSGGANGTFALAFSGGGGTGAAGTFTVTGGAVTAVAITAPGSGYATAPTISTAASSGLTGANITATIGTLANAIAAALPGVLNSILAVGIVQAPGVSRDGDVDYRETIQSERMIVVSPEAKMLDSAGATATADMTAAIAGLFVRRDFEFDGRPFRSILNQPVYGITGVTRGIDFNLMDGSAEAQDLLDHQVASIVRGEAGDDFAIADGGFVHLGYEGTGEDLVWRQIHKVRGRDFIELTAIRTLRTFLGRYNLNQQTITSIVNTVDDIIQAAVARQELLGGRARFDPDLNNPSDLRTGHIYIDARFEEAPVFRKATMASRPYAPALNATIEQLITASNLLF